MSDYIPIELLRKAELATLPPEGGWVAIKGNPYAPRGLRIPSSIRDLDVQHMDIYWAYDEESKVIHHINRKKSPSVFQDWLEHPESLVEYMQEIEFSQVWHTGDMQRTLMTIATPSSETIKFWNGEVALFDDELIQLLVKENYVETIRFGVKIESPLLSDLTRDLIGSLMLDGLSRQQAIQEIVINGMADREDDIEAVALAARPNWFYRPIGGYREMFCEEED